MMKLSFIRNCKTRILLVAPAAAFFLSSIVYASDSDGSRTMTAAQTFETSDEVASAYMLFSSSAGVAGLVPATILRLATRKNVIMVARYSGDEPSGDLRVTGVLVTKSGVVLSQTAPLEESGLASVSLMTIAELKERFSQGKLSLSELENEKTAQGQELERLQQDADTIADVGRIVDAEDELGAVQNDEERLKASLVAAQAQLAALRELPAPTNYQRREAELNAFLTDFSKASRDSTSEVFQKVTRFEEEAANNRAIIEETKLDHLDLLQKELLSVRKERVAVERSRQVVVADRPLALQKEEPQPDATQESDVESDE